MKHTGTVHIIRHHEEEHTIIMLSSIASLFLTFILIVFPTPVTSTSYSPKTRVTDTFHERHYPDPADYDT